MVTRLTEFQFKSFTHADRPAVFDHIIQEHEWYCNDLQDTLGVLFLDRIDGDWAYVVLQPGPDGVFTAIAVDSSFDEREVARDELIFEIKRTSDKLKDSVAKKAQRGLPAKIRSEDPFQPVVSQSRLNPLFKLVSTLESYSPARGTIREIFSSYVDRDGNFVEQFQTTGFDARIWELYLYAYLIDTGFSMLPSVSPDYVVSRLGKSVAIEAVTTNPTQGLSSNSDKEARHYSSTGLLVSPFDNPLPKLDGRFEYKQKNFVPIKLGSALYSKLQKRYWQSGNVGTMPLVLAIETFHEEASLHYSSSALATYLYGFEHSYIYDTEGKLMIVPRKVEVHEFAGKSIPSGFFFLPEAQHISAVLFSNSGTISKFNRMGQQGPFHNPKITLIRSGSCYNFDSDSAVPDTFSYIVGDPEFSEWWGQGLEMFHNPDALHPVERELFPEITHHRFENGLVFSDGPMFQPFASITVNLAPREGRN